MSRFSRARVQALTAWLGAQGDVKLEDLVADARLTLARLERQEILLRCAPDVDAQLAVQHALAGQRLLVSSLTGRSVHVDLGGA